MLSVEVMQGLAPKLMMAAAAVVLFHIGSHLLTTLRYKRGMSRYPMINEKWDAAAKAEFTDGAEEIVRAGAKMAKGGPFRMNDQSTDRLILPTKYIDEIKNDSRLDFHSFISKQFFSTYPGFDGFSESIDQKIFQDAVRIHLTQALSLTVQPLAAETPNTLNLVFGATPEWKECVLGGSMLRCVGRLTALIFLGEEFMNSAEWQRISIMYTVDAFVAATALNSWPALLRPVVHWFLPECRKIREEVKLAQNFITPVVERRRAELAAAAADGVGQPKRKVLDSVDWFTAAAKGKPFDYANAELSLAMASIHTTNGTLLFAMFDLLENPEWIPRLREEIKTVFGAARKWEKNTLFQLRLMDSILKESMRLHPHSIVNMPRVATQEISLSDATKIPKGTYLFIGPVPHQDGNLWPSPTTFIGDRFLTLREQPGQENKHQFVSTSPEITVFGHGSHSCPGRFFASNEIKLLLIHMLMYYDWKLPDGQTSVEHVKSGIGRSPNSRQKVLYRSRQPEVDIDGLVAAATE